MPALYIAPFAGVLLLMHVGLSINVIRNRRRLRAAFGDGGNEALARAVRAQGNFTEYAPLGLLGLWILGSIGGHAYVVSLLAIMLILGRLSHAFSVLRHEPTTANYRFRVLGMALTLAALSLTALLLLAIWLGVMASAV